MSVELPPYHGERGLGGRGKTKRTCRDKTLAGSFRQRAAIPAAALPLHVQVGTCGFTAVVVVRPEIHMHNINKMVYVGIEPWHGLGVHFELLKVSDALKRKATQEWSRGLRVQPSFRTSGWCSETARSGFATRFPIERSSPGQPLARSSTAGSFSHPGDGLHQPR